jgi:hypothetical protein
MNECPDEVIKRDNNQNRPEHDRKPTAFLLGVLSLERGCEHGTSFPSVSICEADENSDFERKEPVGLLRMNS